MGVGERGNGQRELQLSSCWEPRADERGPSRQLNVCHKLGQKAAI